LLHLRERRAFAQRSQRSKKVIGRPGQMSRAEPLIFPDFGLFYQHLATKRTLDAPFLSE